MLTKIREQSLYIGLVIALAGLLASLYFSEVMGLIPCLLCWYQRIALYPLVAIFAVAIGKRSTEAWSYAVPFAVIGWLIALYHTLLTYKIIPETISSCQSGISCAQITWSIFDFVTIPLLSFLAFSVLIVLYIINRNK
jgi:disulfide bond formation protein DsbB